MGNVQKDSRGPGKGEKEGGGVFVWCPEFGNLSQFLVKSVSFVKGFEKVWSFTDEGI